MSKTFEIDVLVRGSVCRRVKGTGNSVAECEADAISNWSSLVGGDYTTAEVCSGSYIVKDTEHDEL